ncbi:hypothetical protein P7C70_g9331, partial [Phenoliferia sp. Uapishka_3]
EGGGIGNWMGAKLWRGVGWMFGVESYQQASSRDEREDVEKGEKEAMLLRNGGKPGQRNPAVVTERRNELRSDDSGRIYVSPDMDLMEEPSGGFAGVGTGAGREREQAETQGFKDLFSDVGGTRKGRSRRNSESAGSMDEFATKTQRRDASQPDAEPPARSLTGTPVLPPKNGPTPPAKDGMDHVRRSSTGSSGSTGGSLVFVRMVRHSFASHTSPRCTDETPPRNLQSDGRLVRKLSTIASEASASNSRVGSRAASTVSAWGRDEQQRTPEEEEGDEHEILDVRESVGGWRSMLPGGWGSTGTGRSEG